MKMKMQMQIQSKDFYIFRVVQFMKSNRQLQSEPGSSSEKFPVTSSDLLTAKDL